MALATRAQPAPSDPAWDVASASSSAPAASDTPPPASPPAGSAAAIAPPGPGASPKKVKAAHETAKAAQLTPIVPSPHDPTRPAFQLYAEIDLPILGVGVVMATARLVRSAPAYCAPLCDPNDLNALDRTTAGFWSPGWGTASDVALYVTMFGAAFTLVGDEGLADALNDSVVIAESALTATAVSSMLTLAAGRPRPFMFGKYEDEAKAPLDARKSADGGLSFLSSHASVSFAIATSMFMTLSRLEPRSKVRYVVLGVEGALASFVASARVLAGKHFITDAAGGAIVGSSVGVLVPALHGSPVKIVPVVSDTQRGLWLAGRF